MNNKIVFSLLACALALTSHAQVVELKPVEFNDIKGAPRYEQPRYLTDCSGKAIMVEKAGNAYPALFDYNKDGKLDLMVGDFGGGKKSNISYFENIGKKRKPKYSNTPEYLKDCQGNPLYVVGG